MAKKDFEGDPGGLIGDAIFSVIKPLYKEAKKQERSARSSRRTFFKSIPKASQKDIVFSVLGRAIRNAGARSSTRDLYYATRPLAYSHSEWEDGRELKYEYFSQTILN